MKPSPAFKLLLLFLVIYDLRGISVNSQDLPLGEAVLALQSSDPAQRERAKLQMLRPENFAAISNYSSEIVRRITTIESEEDAVLLAALSLPPDVKRRVLDSPHASDKVRARLGDKEARDRIIARLNQASSVAEVRKVAGDVLYVNNPEAMKAFAKRLESTQVFEDPHGNKVSVTVLLLQVYGEAHPEAKLFSPSAYLKHANISKEQFATPPHQDYLRQIEEYLREHEQLNVRLNPPLLLDNNKVGVRKAPIVR